MSEQQTETPLAEQKTESIQPPEISADVPGLIYWPRFLPAQEEERLTRVLAASNEWFGVTLNPKARRVIHYGYKYDYAHTHSLQKVADIPAEFMNAVSGLIKRGHKLDQLIINEYLPGQGISAHIDDPKQFGGVIFCITLGSPATMIFEHPDGRVVQKYVLPGSAYMMKGDARYTWRHSIAPNKSDIIDGKKIPRGIRYSLTFREVRNTPAPSTQSTHPAQDESYVMV